MTPRWTKIGAAQEPRREKQSRDGTKKAQRAVQPRSPGGKSGPRMAPRGSKLAQTRRNPRAQKAEVAPRDPTMAHQRWNPVARGYC